MQATECNNVTATKCMPEVNETKWMHSSEFNKVKATKWIQPSECNTVYATNWMQSSECKQVNEAKEYNSDITSR